MDLVLWGVAVIVGLAVVAGLLEAWLKRGKHQPLSSHHPIGPSPDDDTAPLGYEATDLKTLRETLIFNDRLAGQSGAESATFAGLKPKDRGDAAGPRREK